MSSDPGQPEPSRLPTVRLDDLLKRRGMVGTGGEAKIRIQSGEVQVNGVIETRRRKQLSVGDRVRLGEISTEVGPDDLRGSDPDSLLR